MIVSALLNLVYNILSVLLIFNLPALPATISTILDQISGYLVTGVTLIAAFVGSSSMGVMALLLELVILMNAAYLLYSFVMWVLRKIPMLNIRE